MAVLPLPTIPPPEDQSFWDWFWQLPQKGVIDFPETPVHEYGGDGLIVLVPSIERDRHLIRIEAYLALQKQGHSIAEVQRSSDWLDISVLGVEAAAAQALLQSHQRLKIAARDRGIDIFWRTGDRAGDCVDSSLLAS